MPTCDSPIGVLDSGLGGLSILRALHQELPHEHYLYIADQAHLPYGPRPLDEIRAFARQITTFMLGHGVKIIVVACNAASAASLLYLRETFPGVPFVGMEPAVKPAAQATKNGVVGVLTTAATAEGPLYARVKAQYANDVEVHTIICPELVQAVEYNAFQPDDLRPLFDRKLSPVLARGADEIVLGCTHFPFATDAIRQYAGPDVQIVDPSPAVARQTQRLLADHDLLNPTAAAGDTRYYTTGDPQRFATMGSTLLAHPITAQQLHWQIDPLALSTQKTRRPSS